MQKIAIGNEKAPLLVIDNFVEQPDDLIRKAGAKHFRPTGRSFPGVRAKAPLSYQQFLTSRLRDILAEFFQLKAGTPRLSMCHYSLVTTPPAELSVEQRIPHLDSVEGNGLATIHYLFRGSYGGTAFYRHRRTGFEYVDQSRKQLYFDTLAGETRGPCAPEPEYINGDTPLFEQVAKQDGVFNRLLIYRRNSLHSGCIDKAFVPDANPLTGRLSLNSFIDMDP